MVLHLPPPSPSLVCSRASMKTIRDLAGKAVPTVICACLLCILDVYILLRTCSLFINNPFADISTLVVVVVMMMMCVCARASASECLFLYSWGVCVCMCVYLRSWVCLCMYNLYACQLGQVLLPFEMVFHLEPCLVMRWAVVTTLFNVPTKITTCLSQLDESHVIWEQPLWIFYDFMLVRAGGHTEKWFAPDLVTFSILVIIVGVVHRSVTGITGDAKDWGWSIRYPTPRTSGDCSTCCPVVPQENAPPE